MAKKLPETIFPLYQDRYYVYVLCKPCGTPFYVGKGKNGRINEHFKPHKLKVNNLKNNIIKKHFHNIKREIVCYFDLEGSAYDFEEYLINYYGLHSEGGLLSNYAKSRFEYSEKFIQDVCTKSNDNREPKHPVSDIMRVLDLYYRDCKTLNQISVLTGIDVTYLSYLVRGSKRTRVFNVYSKEHSLDRDQEKVLSNKLKDREFSVSEQSLREAYVRACSGEKIKNLADELGCSSIWLAKVFTGKSRIYLGFNIKKDRINLPCSVESGTFRRDILTKVELSKESGISTSESLKIHGISRTSYYRALKQNN